MWSCTLWYTVYKKWSSGLRVGRGANNPSPQRKKFHSNVLAWNPAESLCKSGDKSLGFIKAENFLSGWVTTFQFAMKLVEFKNNKLVNK